MLMIMPPIGQSPRDARTERLKERKIPSLILRVGVDTQMCPALMFDI